MRRSRIASMLAALLLALANAVSADELTASSPGSGGTTRADTNYKIGDRYTYRTLDLFSRVEDARHTLRVTDVTDNQVIFNGGRRVTDRLGNDIAAGKGNQFSGQQIFVPDYGIGRKWTTRYLMTKPDGSEYVVTYDFEIVAKEPITVPAGTFLAYRIEGGGYMHQTRGPRKKACEERNATYKIWIASDEVRRYIAQDYIQRGAPIGCRYQVTTRTELVAFRQGDRSAGVEGPDTLGSEDYVPGHANVEESPHSEDNAGG